MRASRRCANHTRGQRLAAVENLDVNPLRRHAQRCERLLHVCHETSWPAEVDFCIWWDADLIEDRLRQMTGSVEVLTYLVLRARLTVANIAAAVWEREYEAADFSSKWMMLPVASRVHPQDLLCRASRGQRVQHR